MSHTISVSDQTFEQLQELATPFRGSEHGTPGKVINHLLGEHRMLEQVVGVDLLPALASLAAQVEVLETGLRDIEQDVACTERCRQVALRTLETSSRIREDLRK